MNSKIFYNYKKTGKITVVFLHGTGGDLSVWDFMEKPILDKGYSFLSIDLPGHGFSDRLTKTINMQDFSQSIKGILDKEKIEKIILVGHCFGGMVAQELGLMIPKKIMKMILICTYFKPPWWAKYFNPLLSIIKHFPFGPIKEHVNFAKFKNTQDIDVKRLWSDISHVGLASYLKIYSGIKDWNIRDRLKSINFPVLIIGGKKDIIFPPKNQQELAKAIPNAKLILIDSNHIAPVSNPELLKKIIL